MRFRNLTYHPVTIFSGNDKITIQPSGIVARCDEIITDVGDLDMVYEGVNIPIIRRRYVGVPNLPPEEEGCCCIVSWHVLIHASHRKDLVAPDTSVGSGVFDDTGRIIGVRRLQVI